MSATADADSMGFEPLATHLLEPAVALSRREGWPHRYEDWALSMSISHGIAALSGGRLVGTALATPFGRVATLNLIIVAPEMRGRGLGRALVTRAMGVGADEWRLIATRDGLPLYRSLGFVEDGEIHQHQGRVTAMAPPAGPVWARSADAEAIGGMDRAATGMDRAPLLAAISRFGRFAVMRDGDRLAGFAAVRPFGRGEVVGPVTATDGDVARRLLAFILARREGAFVRVDTHANSGLGSFLADAGLACVDTGVRMFRGPASPAHPALRSFALAAQAFG